MLLLSPQPFDIASACTTIIDFVAPDQMLGIARINALSYSPLAVEIGERDIKSVDVRGYDGEKKHDAVEDEVLVWAGDHHYGEGRKEDIADGYDEAFEEWDPHVGDIVGA